jgi:alcohol dehydrogenase class IV
LIFGDGALARLSEELALLWVTRPLLIADRGLEAAGIVAKVRTSAPAIVGTFLDVPENPTAAGADAGFAAYVAASCDGIVAVGGGSVLDTAKIIAALACTGGTAAEVIGKPERIEGVVPLIAIPTTVGTGSESSPVAALHLQAGGPAVGTRGPLMVPKTALCDPALTRTLPRHLIAATGIDALSHCIEGFFAEPGNPVIDAMALDGAARVVADISAALEPGGDAARASLMAAAFMGGAAIHKGVGPAHAVALACADQDLHHGTMIAIALPHTTRVLARNVPDKARRLARAIGLSDGDEIGDALAALVGSLDLPSRLDVAGYRPTEVDALVQAMEQNPCNRTSAYALNTAEYCAIAVAIGLG